jgi:hypothetical protein
MSQLNHMRIGRTTVWRGAHFHAAVRVDAPNPTASEWTPVVELIVRPLDGDELRTSAVAILGGRHIFELASDHLPDGSAELAFLISPPSEDDDSKTQEEIAVADELWVLDRENYQALLAEEIHEEFLDSPLLGPGATSRLLVRLIRDGLQPLALERDWRPRTELLLPDELEQRLIWREAFASEFGRRLLFTEGFGWPSRFAVTWEWPAFEFNWPAAPIQWSMEKLLTILQDLSVRGIRFMHFHIKGLEDRMVVEVSGSGLARFPESLLDTLTDEELGDFYTLSRLAPGLELKYTFGRDDPSFAIRLDLTRDMLAR